MSASFCPKCGRQCAVDANFCAGCGAPAPQPMMPGVKPRLVRPYHPRMIAGVCSGVATYYGWDLPTVRIVFTVFTCLTTGMGILVYLAAWVLIPEAPYALAASVQRQGNSV